MAAYEVEFWGGPIANEHRAVLDIPEELRVPFVHKGVEVALVYQQTSMIGPNGLRAYSYRRAEVPELASP